MADLTDGTFELQDTKYAGEAADFMLTRAVSQMDTYEKDCIAMIDGIKKMQTIDRVEISNFIQDAAATPTSQGEILIDDVELTPAEFDLYLEFNPQIFAQTWWSQELEDLLLGRSLPNTVENYVMLQLMRRLAQYYDYAIWQSRLQYNPDAEGHIATPQALIDETKNENFYYFNGLIKKAIDDAATIKVPSPVALTAANIRSKFDTAIKLVPKALLAKYGIKGLKVTVSYADWLKYNEALRNDAFKNQNTTEKSQDMWNGYEVVRLAGLPENTFFMTISNPDVMSSNAFVGLNEWGDKDNIKLMPLQNNSDLWFIRGKQSMDTVWGYTDQLVMYTMET